MSVNSTVIGCRIGFTCRLLAGSTIDKYPIDQTWYKWPQAYSWGTVGSWLLSLTAAFGSEAPMSTTVATRRTRRGFPIKKREKPCLSGRSST